MVKHSFKRIISENSDININNLPYNTELIKWLMDQRENGRYIVLCTGSDYIYAKKIADHLEVFDEVHASDGVRNLVGFSKANFLSNKFTENNFDYIGNSENDIPVWKASRNIILANCSSSLINKIKRIKNPEIIFNKEKLDFQLLQVQFEFTNG